MERLINIANVPIFLRSPVFFNSLTPAERHLIKPFIVNQRQKVKDNRRFLLADIKFIRHHGARSKDYRIESALIEKIKRIFPNQRDKNMRFFLRFFLGTFCHLYLSDNKPHQEKIKALLEDQCDSNKILANFHGFVLSDRKSRTVEILYRRPHTRYITFQGRFIKVIRAQSGNLPQCYNLEMLKLLFRMVFTSRRDGIMLHASSIERGGSGYVFVGSGASGKSTIVRMLESGRVFSDDVSIIRKVNNVYKIFANPWWNASKHIEIKNPRKPADLKAIFFIKKTDKTSMRKLNHKEALSAFIFQDKPYQQVGFFDNKSGVKHFYFFSRDLIKNIPVFELRVRKSNDFNQEFESLTSLLMI